MLPTNLDYQILLISGERRFEFKCNDAKISMNVIIIYYFSFTGGRGLIF